MSSFSLREQNQSFGLKVRLLKWSQALKVRLSYPLFISLSVENPSRPQPPVQIRKHPAPWLPLSDRSEGLVMKHAQCRSSQSREEERYVASLPLVAMPFVHSSFLLLVVRQGAPSSVLAPI